MFNLLFFCHFTERRWLLMRNLAIILPSKSKWSIKFQRFNTIDESIEIPKNSWIQKISIKKKNCKTFYETKTASRLKEIVQPPPNPLPPDKILISLWNKNLREIHRNIQTFAFKVLQESSCWVSGNGAGQMFFLTPNRNMFAGKFVNWECSLAVFSRHIIFNFKRVEICKITEVSWAKLYYKMSDLFSLVFIGFDIFWFQLLTCGFKLVTGAFELVTRWFELDL